MKKPSSNYISNRSKNNNNIIKHKYNNNKNKEKKKEETKRITQHKNINKTQINFIKCNR